MTHDSEDMKQQAWHALEAGDVLKHLEVQAKGLTTLEAIKRLEHYGPNQLREAPRPTFLQTLWEQLNSFVVILLIVASVVSALLGDYVEAAAIMSIVVLNAILGIVQERRAEEAPALANLFEASPTARIPRSLGDQPTPASRHPAPGGHSRLVPPARPRRPPSSPQRPALDRKSVV